MDPVRQVPRLQQNLTLELPDGWKGDVVDLSAIGMRVQSVLLLPVDTELEGTLVLPDGERLVLKAIVVWATAPDHVAYVPAEMGLELRDIPERYLQAVAHLFADAG
jgi:hypothetical protein